MEKPNNSINRICTARSTSAGAVSVYFAFRVRQSKFRTASARITPVVFIRLGSGTSKGYPFTWFVIGTITASPVLPL